MQIKPEISSVLSFSEGIPVVETSETETTVMVKDGVTIIIGGLIKEEKIKKVDGVPLISKIPVLGKLFSSSNYYTKKTELVIFIMPRIVSGDVDVPSPEIGFNDGREREND